MSCYFTLSVHKLIILFSLIRPLENISAAKTGFRLGRSQHLNPSSPPVFDIHCSPPRWPDRCPRTLPPPDPLLTRPPRCRSDFPTNGHRPSHLGPSILRPPRLTFVHYAVNAVAFRYGWDQDRVGQVHRQSGHLDAFTQDAIGGDKDDVPVECVGCADQCSFDVNHRERDGAGCSWGEMDSQDIGLACERGRERNSQHPEYDEAGSFPRFPAQETPRFDLTKAASSS